MSDLNALRHLVDDYLHEDFVDLYGSAWGAVDSYVRDQPQLAPQLRGEITELLSTRKSEAEVEGALVDLGIVYLPTGDGWDSHRTWLLAVADRVEEILRKSPAA
jgi:hypothetical protein